MRTLTTLCLTLAFLMMLATTLVAQSPHGHGMGMEMPMDMPKEAVVVVQPMSGSNVAGTLTFTQEQGGVRVKGSISGLTPGKHGFHIHEFGDLRDPQGKSAGPHYNPHGAPHGGPDSAEHHAGDLGNIEAGADGVAHVDAKAEGLQLHFVLGRSIVVHAKQDDLKSQPSGDSGDRIGVGVIGLAEAKPPAATK